MIRRRIIASPETRALLKITYDDARSNSGGLRYYVGRRAAVILRPLLVSAVEKTSGVRDETRADYFASAIAIPAPNSKASLLCRLAAAAF